MSPIIGIVTVVSTVRAPSLTITLPSENFWNVRVPLTLSTVQTPLGSAPTLPTSTDQPGASVYQLPFVNTKSHAAGPSDPASIWMFPSPGAAEAALAPTAPIARAATTDMSNILI